MDSIGYINSSIFSMYELELQFFLINVNTSFGFKHSFRNSFHRIVFFLKFYPYFLPSFLRISILIASIDALLSRVSSIPGFPVPVYQD